MKHNSKSHFNLGMAFVVKRYVGKQILHKVFVVLLGLVVLGCGTQKEALGVSEDEEQIFSSEDKQAVEIADDETEYEIIIIEPGFYTWLNSIARPSGYYSQSWLENRNQLLVLNWNQRVLQPQQFNPNLYLWQIDYDPQIDYGYDVNWKLYNYFIYFQRKYRQRLSAFVPRI